MKLMRRPGFDELLESIENDSSSELPVENSEPTFEDNQNTPFRDVTSASYRGGSYTQLIIGITKRVSTVTNSLVQVVAKSTKEPLYGCGYLNDSISGINNCFKLIEDGYDNENSIEMYVAEECDLDTLISYKSYISEGIESQEIADCLTLYASMTALKTFLTRLAKCIKKEGKEVHKFINITYADNYEEAVNKLDKVLREMQNVFLLAILHYVADSGKNQKDAIISSLETLIGNIQDNSELLSEQS